MNEFNCSCKDWKENIDKINSLMLSVWNMTHIPDFKGYTGKDFVYCPWCAKKLKEKKDNE